MKMSAVATPPMLCASGRGAVGVVPGAVVASGLSGRRPAAAPLFCLLLLLVFCLSALPARAHVVDELAPLLGLSDAELGGYESVPYTTDPERLMARLGAVKEQGLNEIYTRIFTGSMPVLYGDTPVDWETYYRSYVDTYLQRDIRDLTQVADEMAFFNFMTVVAAHTSKPVVYEELANAAGISAPTAKKWLSILVSSHIIALVRPYANNVLKRVVKMPLMHFLDTGLAAYLLKWGSPEALERGAMSGAFFESYVFSEI